MTQYVEPTPFPFPKKEEQMPETRTFDYVKYDAIAVEKQEKFKALFERLESDAKLLLAPSRPRSLFDTAIETAYMWVGKAIRDEQIERNSATPHEPTRSNV